MEELNPISDETYLMNCWLNVHDTRHHYFLDHEGLIQSSLSSLQHRILYHILHTLVICKLIQIRISYICDEYLIH